MSKDTLIEFPCDFPVKIIGANNEQFLSEIKSALMKHFSDFSQENLTYNYSEGSKFLAVTVKVHVVNQATLDSFYQDLTKIPDVKMVL